ncbi:hypothetical protein FRC03_001674 [Tulasnella sp. 419]|nr:hypothetical protein FRC03_001674 [Tulasnella sp. 419]
MRRRFGRFLDKVVDRPQSTSPAGTRSPSQTQDVEGCLSTTASTPLLNPHLLKERYQTVQHEELKLSIVDLIGFLESVDGSLDTTIISRLKSEINDLSGIISLLSENHSLSSSHKLSEELARAIDSALKKARVTTSYPSQWDPSIKTNYHKAISQLSDNLHTAIESHRAQVNASETILNLT